MFNILVSSGLIFGKLLSYVTKSEIFKGKKYFSIFELLLLFSVSLILLFTRLSFFSLGFLIGFVLFLLIKRVSLFLGLGVVLSSFISLEFSLLISSLIFFYLLIYSRELSWKMILVDIALFILPFFLLERFINSNLSTFLSIAAGGIFGPVAQLGRTFLWKKRSRKK